MTGFLFLLSLLTLKMVSSPIDVANVATNEGVIVSAVPDLRENMPPMVNEAYLNNLSKK